MILEVDLNTNDTEQNGIKLMKTYVGLTKQSLTVKTFQHKFVVQSIFKTFIT